MVDDNLLEAFFTNHAICKTCITRWKIKADNSAAPPEAKRPRSEAAPAPTAAAADEATPSSATETICPLCFGLAQPHITQIFELDLTPPSLIFDSSQEAQPKDAMAISQQPPQPRVLKTFPSLSEALHALREVWDFDSYALEVSLPAVFAVRAQAAWWAAQPHLLSTDGDTNTDGNTDITNVTSKNVTVRDVRETLRHQYACQLTDLLGTGPAQDSTMRLSFGCRLSSSLENEAQWLAPPPPKIGRKRRMMNRKRGQDGSKSTALAPIIAPLLSSPTMVSKLATMSKQQFLEKCPQSAQLLSPPPPLKPLNNMTINDSTATGSASGTSSGVSSSALVAIVTISPSRLSQYIGGRYLKLQRGIPQSPWLDFSGERFQGDTSVQEEIAKIVLPGLQADEYTFISSGREDIDVRMLGNGRPFALEVKNMRAGMPSEETAAALEKASVVANSGVEIQNLGPLGPESMALLKDGEQEKRKSYAAVCWIPRKVTHEDLEKINALGKQGDVDLEQWTPLRVLHRRPNMCRRRAVHEMAAELVPGLPEGYFLLRLITAAGTYVKEFVHGDRGRTKPCVKDILECGSAECVYLDVTGVDLDF